MSIEKTWNKQYEGEVITALKDDQLFRLEVEAILEASNMQIQHKKPSEIIRVLELGCGTGELIRRMDSTFSVGYPGLIFVGVDFSENAIQLANRQGNSRQKFERSDFLSYLKTVPSNSIELVLTQRAIMALMEISEQDELLVEVNRVLVAGGAGIFSECFNSDLNSFNTLRNEAGLPPVEKVWHSRYLDEVMLSNIFENIDYQYFCSTYMLMTRIAYPMFCDPIHNQIIHKVASQMPNSGSTSFLKLAIVKKRS